MVGAAIRKPRNPRGQAKLLNCRQIPPRISRQSPHKETACIHQKLRRSSPQSPPGAAAPSHSRATATSLPPPRPLPAANPPPRPSCPLLLRLLLADGVPPKPAAPRRGPPSMGQLARLPRTLRNSLLRPGLRVRARRSLPTRISPTVAALAQLVS